MIRKIRIRSRVNKQVTEYTFKRPPYAHQIVGIKKLLSTGFGGALLCAPRTGKTQVIIDYASILHEAGKVNRVLVVCPTSVMGVWEDEIEAVCPYRHTVTTWDKDGRKEWALPPFRNVIDFVIVNYEAFSVPGKIIRRDEHGAIIRSKNRGGKYDLRKQFKAWQPQLIVLDESHRIKSPSAAKTRSLHAIGPVADYRVIATGTAVTKKKRVFDIYSQWKFLKPDGWIHGYTLDMFKNEFGRWTNRHGYPQWLKNDERAIARLKIRIHRDSFAITREECFDLPPMREQIVHVEITGHTAEVYDEMAEEMIAQIKTGEITEAQIKLVQSMRLAQITGGVARTSPSDARPKGRLVRLGRDKLLALEELLDDWYEADEKVVIAARFKADLASIIALQKKMKVKCYELHGEITRRERDANIKGFRVWDGPAAFVMQPQAGSLGIDLSSSANMVWYSLTNSYVDFTQARDRIALTPRGAVHTYLLGRGTIDEEMYAGLQEDEDFAKIIHASPERLRRNFRK